MSTRRRIIFALAALLTAGATMAAEGTRPIVQSDQEARTIDPALHATARQYFPSDETAVPRKRLFRLTRDQLDATVTALLPGLVPRSIKAVMDRDSLHTNYEYSELLEFNAANIGQYSKWVSEIAAKVRQTPKALVDCPTDQTATDCQAAAARRFVMRAFRSEVPEEKAATFVAFYLEQLKSTGSGPAAGDLVEVVLKSPDFLFRKEFGGNQRGRLPPLQHLNALAYVLADAPPDALGAGSNDAVRPPQVGQVAATVDAVLATAPAREKLVRFFMAWLEVKEPNEFTISQEIFPEFDAKLRSAMLAETDQFLRAALAKPAPSLKDLTQATQSNVSKALEPLYGTKAADAVGAKPATLDPQQRLGIFSQPAVLASHSGPTDTRPIKRGVFWVRKVMCMELGPQPPEVEAKLYELDGTTQRQRIEQATEKPACAGCHKVINPFGFFQESYDALGRWRTTDNGAPVDTSIAINFLDEEPNKTAGPVEALRTFTSSLMFKQCFVRQMFRFYMGRGEEPADDPLLRRMFFEFARDDRQDILRTLHVLASSDRILKRQ